MATQLSKPSAPDGMRVYAVGDIHGRSDLLNRMLGLIEADAAEHADATAEVIFLGDYIDRGIDSRGVIQRFCQPMPHGMKATFMRGNHESVMMQFLDGDLEILSGWTRFGGLATLASYGIAPAIMQKGAAAVFAALNEKLPDEHRAFLNATRISETRGDYFFAHAGARPGIPLTQQSDEDCLWIRRDFLEGARPFEKTVVHGHSVQFEPDIGPTRIGIDTGAYATGKLTCLVLQGAEQVFLAT